MEVYMATGRVCGKMIGAVADMPEHMDDMIESITEWLRGGYQISRVTAEAVRKSEFCKAKGNCETCALSGSGA